MDEQTIAAYEARATDFAERHRAIQPLELYRVVLGHFHPGERTADIGCGCGRDVAWLHQQDFRVTGYDASDEMLAAARAAYPQLAFQRAALPELIEIDTGVYGNVLCSAVLMHLPREQLITAVLALARILRVGGRLVLAYRASRGDQEREPDGRLFTGIPPGKLTLLLEAAGFSVMDSTRQPDSTRPGVVWTVILAEKQPLSTARGLDRVQSILAQDAKTATYKLALIRAFCAISRQEAHLVTWGDGEVYVPLWRPGCPTDTLTSRRSARSAGSSCRSRSGSTSAGSTTGSRTASSSDGQA